MGRTPTVNKTLPPGMRKRKRGKQVYYFYDTGKKPRKEIPLGKDYIEALKQYAKLEMDSRINPNTEITFKVAADRYQTEVIPTKAPLTQRDNLKELANLLAYFNKTPAPLEDIEPIHIRKYQDWRVKEAKRLFMKKEQNKGKEPPLDYGQVRANREKKLFSHIWNKCREWGYTDKSNPCDGIKGFKEPGRRVYVEDEVFELLKKHATQDLKDAMDIAYIVGQRVADTLEIMETDIKGDVILIDRNKTGTKSRVNISPELKLVLDRIAQRKQGYDIHCLYLLVNERGQRLTYNMLRNRMDEARENAGIEFKDFQFRDLRAKAASDIEDGKKAQRLLGHSSITTTEGYIRNRKGDKVDPTK